MKQVDESWIYIFDTISKNDLKYSFYWENLNEFFLFFLTLTDVPAQLETLSLMRGGSISEQQALL